MLTKTEQMLSTTPNRPKSGEGDDARSACIEACKDCEMACMSCADSCLGEKDVHPLRQCIRLDLDCVDICGATARMMTRLFGGNMDLLRAQLELCARFCGACAAECEKHEHHEHCTVCAGVCRRCEAACRAMLDANPAGFSTM